MTVSMFITILTMLSTINCLCVEGVKKVLDELKVPYASNVVASIVGCVVGIGGSAVYYVLNGINFTPTNTTAMLMMGFAVSLGSMLGYDKITQAIEQFRNRK